jgi:DNA-binding transcriptional ArsR family regulator
MVECTPDIDLLFSSLADATRRDILKRVSVREMSIGELSEPYKMSFAGIAKHIALLESAKLVTKKRRGKQQIVSLAPESIEVVRNYLKEYEDSWRHRFEALDTLLTNPAPHV